MAIAYFHTWTTYGTWLPGDERGWYEHLVGVQDANPPRKFEAELLMNESAIVLTKDQRDTVERTIRDHCRIRKWPLHALNCRTNHVHVVLTAENYELKEPRKQLKSWTTRKLKLCAPLRTEWWTDYGWDVYLDDDEQLARAIDYVQQQ